MTAGDLVIIAHIQNLESIYAFWGALQMGAIPSMFPTLTEKLDPDIYMRNMNVLVRRSGVRLIFTSDAFAPVMARTVSCPVLGSSELAGLAEQAGGEDFSPTSLVQMTLPSSSIPAALRACKRAWLSAMVPC